MNLPEISLGNLLSCRATCLQLIGPFALIFWKTFFLSPVSVPFSFFFVKASREVSATVMERPHLFFRVARLVFQLAVLLRVVRCVSYCDRASVYSVSCHADC